MEFTTLRFALFFCVVFALYYMLPQRFRWPLLICADMFFMAYSFTLSGCAAFFAAAVFSYGGAVLCAKSKNKTAKRLFAALGAGIPICLLILFKYIGFIPPLFGGRGLELAAPLGISYYTLQTISYCVDVYREKIAPEKHFGYYFIYLTFFPYFISGPIERAGDILSQLKADKKFDYSSAKNACFYIVLGMFQKLAVANNLANFADKAFNNPQGVTGMSLLFAAVLYSVQIYADFAGYSNMALGLAKLLGIKITQNFKQPYFSLSIKEFWRRWHISLSLWLKDYIYIPLGGSRCKKYRHCLNLFITFIVSGLWHGAGLCFAVWGALHGLYQIVGMLLRPIKEKMYKRLHIKETSVPVKALKMLCLFVLVGFAWIFFRVGCIDGTAQMPADISTAWYIIKKIAADFSLSYTAAANGLVMISLTPVYLVRLALLTAVFFAAEAAAYKQGFAKWLAARPAAVQAAACYVLLIFSTFFSADSGGFLYFKF